MLLAISSVSATRFSRVSTSGGKKVTFLFLSTLGRYLIRNICFIIIQLSEPEKDSSVSLAKLALLLISSVKTFSYVDASMLLHESFGCSNSTPSPYEHLNVFWLKTCV